ncbi:MAG: hypothetical protein N2489_07145 [Clostridia bacterium]|nr:hypothetical protein [Clostridia bacterium]
MYKYKAFGLTINSQFLLPELIEADGAADVEIVSGEIEADFMENGSSISICCLSKSKIIYKIADIAACSVEAGRKVTISPAPGIKDSTLRVFILTSVFGCIFFQRMMLPIHGSAVVKNDKCIVIAGDSGAGKSTLTTEFLNNGYKLLTDDIAVIEFDNKDRVHVQPAFPQRKLRTDTAEKFCIDKDTLEQLEIEDQKYLVNSEHVFVNSPTELEAVIELSVSDTLIPDLKKLSGMERFCALMNNVYRGSFINIINSQEHYFKKVGKLAALVQVFKLTRPSNGFTSNQQMKLICKELDI